LKCVVSYAEAAPPRDQLEEWLRRWTEAERELYALESDSRRKSFWDTVNSTPIFTYLSPWERQFASTTMLTMSSRQQLDAMWRVEAAQVLMWALRLIAQLPPPDTQADDPNLLKAEILSPPSNFLNSAALRPQAETDHARDVAELWHWRSRTEELIREAQPFPSHEEIFTKQGIKSYQDIVRLAARAAHERGDLHLVIRDDFPAKGKSYAELSPEEWSEVQSISIERHRALNWLCGYSPHNDWDTTPMDT
jgi:hypothetical protein